MTWLMAEWWPSPYLTELCMHGEETEPSNRDQIRKRLPKENAKTFARGFYSTVPIKPPCESSASESIKFSESSSKRGQVAASGPRALLATRVPNGAEFPFNKTLKLHTNLHFLLTPQAMTLHTEIEESSPKHPRRRFYPWLLILSVMKISYRASKSCQTSEFPI